jgi:hypothetical protein
MLAVEHEADESTCLISAYDQTKWNLGTLMKQVTTVSPNYIGPPTTTVFRPYESAGAVPGVYPWAMQWSSTKDWIFLADIATAAATRRILLCTYDRSTPHQGPQYEGFITITFPTATNHTIHGFRMTYDLYTTGTAAVSGTAVTGTSTAWQTSRLASGSRIGFGSTDPTAISTWYEISSIGGDASITLTSSAGTVVDGPYVIEELRAVITTTNATTTNGGLFVVKGLRKETFAAGGTAISAAVATDNVRACFWLADAASVTNTVADGCCLKARDSWTQHYVYVPDGASTTLVVFKYNIRAALTLASGKDTTAFQYKTGNNTTTGAVSVYNNGRLVTAGHGPGSGVLSLYLVTASRVYRALESGITTGSTTILTDAATEVPPGSVNTFAATGALASIEYATAMDRFVITTSGATAFRSYVTQYRTDAGQWDHIMFADDKQIDQASADSGVWPHGTTNSVLCSPWSEGGILYYTTTGTAATTNFLRVLPIGCDWQYASTTSQYVITPRYATPNCYRFNSVYAIRDCILGSVNLGVVAEAVRLYYRTSGISDNSGTWTLVADGNDLSGASAATEIQFKIEFRCISTTCAPARIFRVGVTYEDLSTDAHYQPSVKWSSTTSKQFSWRFSTAFGTTVPQLLINIYDAVTGSLLNTDDSTTKTGTWEQSTDGGSNWVTWTNADKTNETTYLRYTPSSLSDSVRARALLKLY